MSALPRLNQQNLRQSVVIQTASLWNASERKIGKCVKKIVSVLSEQDAKDRLKESYRILKGISDDLSYNNRYIRTEDPLVFKELWFRLIETFKDTFESFMIENHTYTANDKRIDDMSCEFYETLAWMRGLEPERYVNQAYPPVTVVIRTIRNCAEHVRDKPVDHITRKKSFGNIFTLSSIYILSIYAYLEILTAWIDTIC